MSIVRRTTDIGGSIAARALLGTTQALAPSLTILIFHRVLPERDPLQPAVETKEDFDRLLGWMTSQYRMLPLGEAVKALRAGKLTARSACVTFDDGYLDNLQHAMPIAEHHGVPFTVFSTTAHMDGSMMWNDRVIEAVRHWSGSVMELEDVDLGRVEIDTTDARRSAIRGLIRAIKYREYGERMELCTEIARRAFDGRKPPRLMMNEHELAELAARGVELGGHTHSHPILANLDDSTAESEIANNRNTLRELSGQRVSMFAYPNGAPGKDYTAATINAVRRVGFDGACSTSLGVSRHGSDPYQLPRFLSWHADRGRFMAAMALNALKRGPDSQVARD